MKAKTGMDLLRDRLPYYQLQRNRASSVQLDWKKEWERFDAKALFEFDPASISADQLAAMRKRKDLIMDGNHAVLSILTRLVDGLCGYPITPSTPVAEEFAKAASNGVKNLFDHELMYFQPSDELSAIAAVEAMATQGGRYVDNSSSQGLILKTKNLFSVAGKRLPVVMNIAAREVNKGSLSIHCGHADFYGVRNAGWAQLVSCDNQELHDLLPVAFKVAELRQVMLPCMVIGDGFIKSHSIENIGELSDEFLRYFVGFPNRLYQPRFGQSTLVGTFTDADLTMEGQISQDFAYRFLKRAYTAAMNAVNKILGTNLKIVENYRTEDADMVIVILGSAAGVVKDVVDYYRSERGWKVGVVRPVLFAPPCYEEIAYGLRNAKAVTVLERTGNSHNQLLLGDVEAALQVSMRAGREGRPEHHIYSRDYMPTLLHGVYGLGSKDFNKYDAGAVIENMHACLDKCGGRIVRDFFVGVDGPYTLGPQPLPGYEEREVGMTFIGIGAEGVKTALETAAYIYSEDCGEQRKYVQSGARYGAARKGGAVFMNLRISDYPIRNSSELTERDVLAFFNEKFLLGQILREYVGGIKEKGLFIVNTPRSAEEILATFPREIQDLIAQRGIRLVAMDATSAALTHLNRNLPGTAIIGLINKQMGIIGEKDFEERVGNILSGKIGKKKGLEIIESNMALLRYGASMAPDPAAACVAPMLDSGDAKPAAFVLPIPEDFGQGPGSAGLHAELTAKDELGTIKPPNLWDDYEGFFYQEMVKPISEGRRVPWDHFLPVVPGGTSKYRDMSYIGGQLPVYDASKCTMCGTCTASCPDSALYSTITDRPLPEGAARYFKSIKKAPGGLPWERFALNINVISEACKGCGICEQVCPTGALKLVSKTEVEETDFLPEEYKEFDRTADAAPFVDTLPLMQQVLFVFSKIYPGRHTLCPGCGEGAISLLTFFAAESLRNHPAGIATFYQGIKVLSNKHRDEIEHMLDHGFNIYCVNATGCNQVSELANPFNSRVYQSGHYGFGTASAAALGAKFSLDQAYSNGFKDVLTKIIVFAGDGAIYDIGNGPFNYALGENFDITWVIFNNEGYMNTGAQKSGATRFGTDRSTSPIGTSHAGKTTLHRRIMAQATSISHVYTAKLSIDNPQYAIKILKEAIAYNGPSVVEFFSPCPQGQQAPDWAGPMLSRMMVESRKWQIAVRRPFQRLDISANPEADKLYPTKGKSFKKGVSRDAATFFDVVSMLGQYNQHIKTQAGEIIPEIIQVNETVSLFRWLRAQYLAGYRDSMPTEDEVERIVAERYGM
ncbi:MAG: 2-oxoacid:acceptor oxidoreductase family protein [Syntrophobacteraceae bacterium]|nr:2-oxoacid:acceptor oxidoreductase family protein [Syntrophobacteraceae bacterium]